MKNGCFGYKDHEVLKDVSFEVEENEVLAILGPNGVGKTTLLKCMMGLLHWGSGESFLNGRSMRKYSQKEISRKIAYVPQSKGISLSYTAFEMVLMRRSARLGLLRSRQGKMRRSRTRRWQMWGSAFYGTNPAAR